MNEAPSMLFGVSVDATAHRRAWGVALIWALFFATGLASIAAAKWLDDQDRAR